MNESISETNKVVNTFDRMWLDSLLSLSPAGTYREAWNAVNVTDAENAFGIANEASTEIFVDLPGEIRGLLYVEERDQYVAFIDTEAGGEIGIIDEKNKSYTRVTTTEIASELGICQSEFIDAEVKILQPCNQLHLYWSTNDVYKRLNLDDPCCKFEEIPLIKPICLATIDSDIVEQGGGLPNGIYQFAAKARDIDGNDSNWSRISNAVSISDGEHKPGERSSKAINLKIKIGNNRDYHIVDLAVIKTIDGFTSIEQFATVSASSDSTVINHVYTGTSGREFPILLSDITTRTNRYIRGKNLVQYDNRLILYNLRPIPNLDYQRFANQIKTKYVNYIVPLEHAHLFKGLRSNENYWFAIRWNYEDGTSSVNFPIPGRSGGPGICDVYKDTSSRTRLYLQLDPKDDEFSVEKTTDHSSVELLDDETTSIPENDLDTGTLEDEVTKAGEEGSQANRMGDKECLCEAARKLKAAMSDGGAEADFSQTLTGIAIGLGTSGDTTAALADVIAAYGAYVGASAGGWTLNDDVIGAITLEQILCSCDTPDGFSPGDTTYDPVHQFTDEPTVTSLVGSSSSKSFDKGTDSDVRPGQITGTICKQEGYTTCNNNVCYTCQGGVWQTLINGDSYYTNNGYTKGAQRGGVLGLRSNITNTNHTELGFEYEYAEDGCTVIGIKPIRYSEGNFGAWETQETYPRTLNCECDFIYGELAGKNIRLHKVPSVSKEPHFISFASGVPNKFDMANSEFKDTYMFMIGPEFENIVLPSNPPKPLCKLNPYSITFVERTEGNKTVIGSGLGHSCFLGEIGGENYAFPKHALNSFERFDRHIEPNGPNTFRGGGPIDVGAYIIHSPDFHMRRPPLDATECLIELELFGKGFRHGTMAMGEKPEHASQDRINQKGTRQALNINHYITLGEPIIRSVKAMSKAPADSIVSRSNKFTYNLCNLHRESSTYVELDGTLQPFTVDVTKYGGSSQAPDGASDRSFTGDIFTESIPIHSARGHYMTFIRKLPSQYGSPINQAYIPLGLEAKGFTPKISGLVGDSFVGPMTYKRTALVSDKTNRLISKFVLTDGLAGKGAIGRILGNLLASLFRVLGLRNGGYIPKSQDQSDHIRIFGGLRHINPVTTNGTVVHPGEVNGTIGPPDPIFPAHVTPDRTNVNNDINRGDNYFPQGLKTQLVSYFNGDVNMHYRQLNNVENGEVIYSHDAYTLKGLKIDSSLPEDTPWVEGWLNRWYSLWVENAKWKLIVQGVFTFLFTYIIGLWLVFKGIDLSVTALQAVGGGSYGLQTVGALLALVFGVLVIAFGIAWIKFWVNSDADNKLIEEYIGLKNIRPDRRNVDGSFSFNENRLRQFEDNYWRCDNTHSQVNRWEVSYGMSDPYITCVCPTEYHNSILYSNKQNQNSNIDAWRNFKPNNDLEIPTENGQIMKMFKLGDTLYAHTTDMLIKLHKGGKESKVDESNLLLGTGNLFGGATPIYGGVVEGYAGLLDPNAAEVSSQGYVFPDRESRKWYTFTGELPKPISNLGVNQFMNENMTFKLLERYPNFKLVDQKTRGGIGFSFGVDHENNRMLFTKIDYIPLYKDIVLDKNGSTFSLGEDKVSLLDPRYFQDVSFTLSYSMRNGGWISFHNYTPSLYAWNRFDMYSFDSNKMWRHNAKGNFQTYYGTHYPFSLEYVVNDKGGDAFSFTSAILDTEAYVWKERDYLRKDVTFDEMIAYNSHQCTGLKPLAVTGDMSLSERSVEYHDKIQVEFKNRIWGLSKVADYLIDKEDFIFDPTLKIGPKPVNNNNISKTHIKNKIFYDNYFANRLIFNTFEDVKLILKRVETEIDHKSR